MVITELSDDMMIVTTVIDKPPSRKQQ